MVALFAQALKNKSEPKYHKGILSASIIYAISEVLQNTIKLDTMHIRKKFRALHPDTDAQFVAFFFNFAAQHR